MDDRTVGRALRALRDRRGLRQADLAAAAGLSQSTVSRAELGELGRLRWDHIRSLFAAVDAGCSVTPWWRSGSLDRLLDEDRAMIVALAASYLSRHGWVVAAEVSFSIYGERGSIDLLATRREDGAVLMVEVKSRLMSVEELLRTLDRKVRLARRIVAEREHWSPRIVGRLVVLADDTTNRDRVGRAEILALALPLRAVALRRWLITPSGPAAGVVFLRPTRGTGVPHRGRARERIRVRNPRTTGVSVERQDSRVRAEYPRRG